MAHGYRVPSKVYPRVCGGTAWAISIMSIFEGLSPRVRGNRGRHGKPLLGIGSIPACAGEPASPSRLPDGRAVYPRVCGGTNGTDHFYPEDVGLSPRVRGNRMPHDSTDAIRGSIPACAGEPMLSCWPRMRHGVYPRVCGGTQSPGPFEAGGYGLSPRVRGNQGLTQQDLRREGSIPACAGEPALENPAFCTVTVYPRVCGGTGLGQHQRRPQWGLSPRVRGNPSRSFSVSSV